MSSGFPSAAALASARQRHEDALAAAYPGTVILSGSGYAAAINVGPVEWLPVEGGQARGQRVTVRILKSLLATAPAKDVMVSVNGVQFQISTVGGRNAFDKAWVISAVRWEGKP